MGVNLDKEQRLRIGSRIKEIRNSRGMSRHAVASAIGRGYQWIWNIETGRKVPSVSAAFELAALLGVGVAEILGEEPEHAA